VLSPMDARRAPVPSTEAEAALTHTRKAYGAAPRALRVVCDIADDQRVPAGIEWLQAACHR
jgi:hypothetical protein